MVFLPNRIAYCNIVTYLESYLESFCQRPIWAWAIGHFSISVSYKNISRFAKSMLWLGYVAHAQAMTSSCSPSPSAGLQFNMGFPSILFQAILLHISKSIFCHVSSSLYYFFNSHKFFTGTVSPTYYYFFKTQLAFKFISICCPVSLIIKAKLLWCTCQAVSVYNFILIYGVNPPKSF